MARFFLSTSEHEMLKQKAANYDTVVQALVASTEGAKAEDITSEMIVDLITQSAETNGEEALQKAQQKIQTLEEANANILMQIDSIHPNVKNATDATAKVEAIKAELAQRPGVVAQSPQGDSSLSNQRVDEIDQTTIDNLPHNKEADQVL